MTKISYDSAPAITAYWLPVRTTQQIQDAGLFKDSHDTIVRCNKTDLAAVEFGKIIELFDTNGTTSLGKVRVDEFTISPINPEWVLGCKSIWN